MQTQTKQTDGKTSQKKIPKFARRQAEGYSFCEICDEETHHHYEAGDGIAWSVCDRCEHARKSWSTSMMSDGKPCPVREYIFHFSTGAVKLSGQSQTQALRNSGRTYEKGMNIEVVENGK